jgi:hypothetical protein
MTTLEDDLRELLDIILGFTRSSRQSTEYMNTTTDQLTKLGPSTSITSQQQEIITALARATRGWNQDRRTLAGRFKAVTQRLMQQTEFADDPNQPVPSLEDAKNLREASERISVLRVKTLAFQAALQANIASQINGQIAVPPEVRDANKEGQEITEEVSRNVERFIAYLDYSLKAISRRLNNK